MPQLPVSEVAALVGKSSKTLYRLISQGTLSATLDENRRKQIDKAELLRVFGQLRPQREKHESPETIPMSQREIDDKTARIALLEAELRHARELLTVREGQIEDLRRTVLLLEDRSHKKSFWPW